MCLAHDRSHFIPGPRVCQGTGNYCQQVRNPAERILKCDMLLLTGLHNSLDSEKRKTQHKLRREVKLRIKNEVKIPLGHCVWFSP